LLRIPRDRHVAVVKHFYGFIFQNGFGKEEEGHVGASLPLKFAPHFTGQARAINGKEPEAGGGEAKQVAVGVGHQLVAFFGGSIQANGMVHIVAGTEGHFGVVAIYAAGAGIRQVFYVVVAAGPVEFAL
jgi:hypothetical protein